MSDLTCALIFNIQRFSIQDGPGIRTTVFFKGCPLRCQWCSNPEGQEQTIEIAHNKSMCKSCFKCVNVCPMQAMIIVDGKSELLRERCNHCDKCIEVCPNTALKKYGKLVSIDDIMEVILRDVPFYTNSGGGVTASGGEPLLQADAVQQLFSRCKYEGIHTCLETSGFAPQSELEKVVDVTDLFYYDLKHMDSLVHEEFTGVKNELILSNLSFLADRGARISIRIPLIPGINDSGENIGALAKFVRNLSVKEQVEVHILPYHVFGVNKYEGLGKSYPLNNFEGLDSEADTVKKALTIIKGESLECRVEM